MRLALLAALAVIIVAAGASMLRGGNDAAATPEQASTATVEQTTTEVKTVGDPADEAEEVDEAAEAKEAAEAAEGSDVADTTADGATDDAAAGATGAADEATAGAGGAAAVSLPDGYEQVPYLSDAKQQSFEAPEDVLDPALDYIAVIGTNRGDITVDLFEDLTPETVNNFVFLALHHYYEGVPFHRVIDNFMAQTGDPTGTGGGGPGYQFDDEIVDSLSFDGAGVLAMANAGKAPDGSGTNGSQFFITFEATSWLDGAHTIFGEVTDGLDVLPDIVRVDPSQPSAIAMFTDPVSDLAAKGVDLGADPSVDVATAVEAVLGELPAAGEPFVVDGYRAVVGSVAGEAAFGFYFNPDVMETVTIGARAK